MKRMIEYAWWGRRRHAETKEQEEVWCSVKEILDMERRGQRWESAKKRNKRGQTRQSERQKEDAEMQAVAMQANTATTNTLPLTLSQSVSVVGLPWLLRSSYGV